MGEGAWGRALPFPETTTMEILKAIFGEMLWPLAGLFAFVVVAKTGFAIWETVRKNLVIVVLLGLAASGMADEIPYEPIMPSDLSDAIGSWGGGTSTLLGELHLIRELLLLQVKIMVMGFGALVAYIGVSQIRPR